MSQLLLVSADLGKIKRSATFRVQKGEYRFECSEVDIGFHMIFGDGDKIAVKHGDPIPVPKDCDFYLEVLPDVNSKKVTVVLGDLN